MNHRRKTWLYAGSCLAILAVNIVALVVAAGYLREIRSLTFTQEELSERLADLTQLARLSREGEALLERMSREESPTHAHAMNRIEFHAAFSQLSELAQRNDVQFTSVRPSDQRLNGRYTEMELDLSLLAPFNGLHEFLGELVNFPFTAVVKDLHVLAAPEDGLSRADLVLVLYGSLESRDDS